LGERAIVEQQKNDPVWMAISSLAVLSIYAYVSLEWVFFVTKPSFMSSMGLWDRLAVLIIAPLPPTLLALAFVLLVRIPGLILRRHWVNRFLNRIAALFPVVVIALTLYLLIDNFTYTVFGFGVGTSSEDQSWIYVLRAFFLIVLSWIWVTKRLLVPESRKAKTRGRVCLFLLLVSVGTALWTQASNRLEPSRVETADAGARPDILLLGSDGLNAEHLSLYGYERDTTPFLRELTQDALICENAFTNSAHTGASIASMLTGRPPTGTRLVYPPDILRGEDVYRHLPAILKGIGYRNVDVSIRYYADAPDMNMRYSFDFANSRRFGKRRAWDDITRAFGPEVAYFLETMGQRVKDRYLHLRGVKRMGDAFAEVAGTESKIARTDSERLKELFRFIDESPKPYFAHLHLMGTHEPYRPSERIFSDANAEPNSMDAYDDTILTFDEHVRRIVEFLKERNRFENTLIIVHSDHGVSFRTNVRLPLVFRFPNGANTGSIGASTQNLDIAPTILDYLGLEVPSWMEGQSLLVGKPAPNRPIFSGGRPPGTAFARGQFWQLDQAQLEPPFYSLGVVSMISCNTWFRFDLGKGTLSTGLVIGHTEPCSDSPSPGKEDARAIILKHLEDNGFDTSSLAGKN